MQGSQFSEFSFHRRKAGLTLQDAAELLGISLGTAYQYESGEAAPRISELQALKGLGFIYLKRAPELEARWFEPAGHSSDPPTVEPTTKKKTRQLELGQFLTSDSVSAFMARLFPAVHQSVRLLDAGAGKGALAAAFVKRWRGADRSNHITAHCYELDRCVLDDLRQTLRDLEQLGIIETAIFEGDFVERAATMIKLGKGLRYTHAILNPPYKKINSDSRHRALLSSIGLETVNLYSGFVGLAVALMESGGEVVAIIPRSFCNGPYYQSFRRFILARASIRHIHLFKARDKAFKDDGVLQENVIVRLTRGAVQGEVTISTSTDDTLLDYWETTHPFEHIVHPNDDKQFIHIPNGDNAILRKNHVFKYRLDELGLSVSTGPVVDFRMKSELRANPEPGTVPLLYPAHFSSDRLQWPKPGFKKANAIVHTQETAKWLFPSGFYTVVRRFSSKEERRRIVASVVDPAALQSKFIGFENHLNVVHAARKPLDEATAHGVAVYLNTTVVDQYFRRFNGHTQVNAADLRTIWFPCREALIAIGEWVKQQHTRPSQEAIDARVNELR